MDPILQLILNQLEGKQLLENYQQIFWHTTFGKKHISHPKKPSMQEKCSGSLGS